MQKVPGLTGIQTKNLLGHYITHPNSLHAETEQEIVEKYLIFSFDTNLLQLKQNTVSDSTAAKCPFLAHFPVYVCVIPLLSSYATVFFFDALYLHLLLQR